jgi:hypothetical protein
MTKNEDSIMNRRWLVFAFLLDLLAFLGLLAWGKRIAPKLEPEVFKVLAQLVMIVVLGGLGSHVNERVNRRREHRQQTRERLRDALSDLVKSYNKIKSLRRRLRAEAIRPNSASPDAVVTGKEYGALLQGLNDEQLGIEAYVHLIKGNQDLYPDPQLLIKNLGGAERHLGQLITEWEKNLGSFRGVPPHRSLAKLPVLRRFVGNADMGFKPALAEPISRVLVKLSRAIAK